MLLRLNATARNLVNRVRFGGAIKTASTTARPGPHDLIVVLDHLHAGFNAGQIVYTADGFGAREIYLTGPDDYVPTPAALAALRRVKLTCFATFAACHARLVAEGYTIYALQSARADTLSTYLDETPLARRCALVVGHTREGISFSASDFPDVRWLSIRQYGAVPNLQSGSAAAVAMYEYVRQHGKR